MEKPINSRTMILVFPFAAPNNWTIANKFSKAVSRAALEVSVTGGVVPDNLEWSENIKLDDIHISLHYLKDKSPKWMSALSWIGKTILIQLLFSWKIFLARKDTDIIICFMGIFYHLPVIVAKILNKKVLSTSFGIYTRKAEKNYSSLVVGFVRFSMHFIYRLSDGILVESLRLGNDEELVSYQSKLLNGAMYLEDPGRFKVWTPLIERGNLIGFIGRLVAEKGIIEFLHAIPLVIECRPDQQFLILGSGILDEAVDGILQREPWASHVTRIKWIDHSEIHDCLNQLKLLVMPSFDEGLPNLILEAMGCGTPVLTTTVGAIPDLVIDGETGFLLKERTPIEIATSILEVMDYPDLSSITYQAKSTLDQSYSFSASIVRYQAIIDKMIA